MEPEISGIIDCIQASLEGLESHDFDEAVAELDRLFGKIVDDCQSDRGFAAIVLSMVGGDIRRIGSANTEGLLNHWFSLVSENGLEPSMLPRDEVASASKRIFGREDAFVYRGM